MNLSVRAHPALSGTCILFLLLWLLPGRVKAAPDTARFYALLLRGDSIYSQKQGYSSFLQSLPYFDSAQVLAERSGDKELLAQATFARGRVYDAWNREPQKTIELFSSASQLFREAGNRPQYYYVKHLVAHAHDKTHDSLRTAAVLRELIGELVLEDSATRQELNFIPEMALVATEVGAYGLADSILTRLTQRSWIANDPSTYNYLDHYYLTQSRLGVYWRKSRQVPYLDSLATAFQQLSSPLDRLYYAKQLADLYGTTGNYPPAYHFRTIQNKLERALAADQNLERMQQALAVSETAAERRKLEYEQTLSKSRALAVWVLSFLLAVITVLSMYLFQRNKKYRAQSGRLAQLNGELDTQISKVEVLNKEIQHRVKNNLYTIYSLLHMQQESTDNEEVIAHLEAARLRVESVAALHDHLLAGSDTVDFGAYLRVLVTKIVDCLADERKVVTHIDARPVSLPLNTCFALSLILNEWITNSIKYARSRQEMLEMDVSIAVQDGEVCIRYTDNGQITPQSAAAVPGLGTEIVRLLTAQIRGRLSTVKEHPYHYQLYIPHGAPH